MNRRHFLVSIIGTAAVAQLAACVGNVDDPEPGPGGGGGGGGSGPDAGTALPASFPVTNTDSSGHSHAFQIQCAHVTEDGWTYIASGAHSHSVTLTGEQLQAIFSGQSVTVQTNDSHAHTWLIARPADRC